MKFGFPFASAMHFLAWGLVDFTEGYVRSNQLEVFSNFVKLNGLDLDLDIFY